MTRGYKRKISLIAVVSCVTALILGAILAFIFLQQDQPQMLAAAKFDTQPPEITINDQDFSLLVFSKTNGYRHHEAIKAGNTYLKNLASEKQWQIVVTENAATFNDQQLAYFDVIIWNNVTGPALTNEQRASMKRSLEKGVGFLGIHAAGDDSHNDWTWYRDHVIGAAFSGHTLLPQFQQANLMLGEPHAINVHLPNALKHEDEWYSFQRSPRKPGIDILYTVDEKSYSPGRWINGKHLAMGDDHPVAWAHQLVGAHVVYIAIGHRKETYEALWFQQLLIQSIEWAGKISTVHSSKRETQ